MLRASKIGAGRSACRRISRAASRRLRSSTLFRSAASRSALEAKLDAALTAGANSYAAGSCASSQLSLEAELLAFAFALDLVSCGLARASETEAFQTEAYGSGNVLSCGMVP
eukprot:3627324-Amphidinium_carterae.1